MVHIGAPSFDASSRTHGTGATLSSNPHAARRWLIALRGYDLLWSLAISGSQLTFFFHVLCFIFIIIASIFPCCGRYLGVTADAVFFFFFLIDFCLSSLTRGRFYAPIAAISPSLFLSSSQLGGDSMYFIYTFGGILTFETKSRGHR